MSAYGDLYPLVPYPMDLVRVGTSHLMIHRNTVVRSLIVGFLLGLSFSGTSSKGQWRTAT